jgi:hypothetical protein
MDNEDFDPEECSDPENCLHHGPSPDPKEILYSEGYEVSHGHIALAYGGGLSPEDEERYRVNDGLVSYVIVRVHTIEPQTGMKVPITFLMPAALAHGLGLSMVQASFHQAESLNDVWEPVTAPPSESGVRVAASWGFLEKLLEDEDGENDD